MPRSRLSFTLLMACLCTSAARGQSLGRWQLPSTPAQYCGYGNGGGHHAPMVRTPGSQPPYVPRWATAPPCHRNAASGYANCACHRVSPGSSYASGGSRGSWLLDQQAMPRHPAMQRQTTVPPPSKPAGPPPMFAPPPPQRPVPPVPNRKQPTAAEQTQPLRPPFQSPPEMPGPGDPGQFSDEPAAPPAPPSAAAIAHGRPHGRA